MQQKVQRIPKLVYSYWMQLLWNSNKSLNDSSVSSYLHSKCCYVSTIYNTRKVRESSTIDKFLKIPNVCQQCPPSPLSWCSTRYARQRSSPPPSPSSSSNVSLVFHPPVAPGSSLPPLGLKTEY